MARTPTAANEAALGAGTAGAAGSHAQPAGRTTTDGQSGHLKTQAARPPGAQTLEAAALWILDLGISAEARRWAASDSQHPAAACLELIGLMETLAGTA